jgi:hypothetical protein
MMQDRAEVASRAISDVDDLRGLLPDRCFFDMGYCQLWAHAETVNQLG